MANAGNVYVFNLMSQDLTLSTNGRQTPGGTIPAWSMSGAAKYQPVSQAVQRVLNASDGAGNFCNGMNSLMLQWIDGLFFAAVQIDGRQFPLNQDLILLVTRNKWHLVNQYSVEVAEGDVNAASMLRDALAATETQ